MGEMLLSNHILQHFPLICSLLIFLISRLKTNVVAISGILYLIYLCFISFISLGYFTFLNDWTWNIGNMSLAFKWSSTSGVLIALPIIVILISALVNPNNNKSGWLMSLAWLLTWSLVNAVLSKNVMTNYLFIEVGLLPLAIYCLTVIEEQYRLSFVKWFALIMGISSIGIITVLMYLGKFQNAIFIDYVKSVEPENINFNFLIWPWLISILLRTGMLPFIRWYKFISEKLPFSSLAFIIIYIDYLMLLQLIRFLLPSMNFYNFNFEVLTYWLVICLLGSSLVLVSRVKLSEIAVLLRLNKISLIMLVAIVANNPSLAIYKFAVFIFSYWALLAIFALVKERCPGCNIREFISTTNDNSILVLFWIVVYINISVPLGANFNSDIMIIQTFWQLKYSWSILITLSFFIISLYFLQLFGLALPRFSIKELFYKKSFLWWSTYGMIFLALVIGIGSNIFVKNFK